MQGCNGSEGSSRGRCLMKPQSTFVNLKVKRTAMAENKRRKIESEGRVFNPEWTNKYLFTVVNSKILCLVCRKVVSAPK